jgi:hypothetical protein
MDAIDTMVNGTQHSDHDSNGNGNGTQEPAVAKLYATRAEAENTIPAGSSKHLKFYVVTQRGVFKGFCVSRG